MAQNYEVLQDKIYVQGTPGGTDFNVSVLPGYNTPYGYREATREEATKLAEQHKNMLADTKRRRASGERVLGNTSDPDEYWGQFEKEINKQNAPMVRSYTAPWGEVLTNVPLSQIQQIEREKQQADQGLLKNVAPAGKPPMYVPTGSPGDLFNTNKKLYEELYGKQNQPAPTPTPSKTLGNMLGGATAYPTQQLQPGAQGDTVKQLQDYLVSKGYMTREQVNTGYGNYGPQTTAAVLALQKDLGIDYSSGPGYFGPKTLEALNAKEGGNLYATSGNAKSSSGAPNPAQTVAENTQTIAALTQTKTIKELMSELGIGQQAPTAPKMVDTYNTLRSQEGLPALETSMNELKKKIRDMDASYEAGDAKQQDRKAPMEIIGSKQQKLYTQYKQERIKLENDLATLKDEYTTKLNAIGQVMQFTAQDYNNASSEYQTKFNNAIKLYDMIDKESDEKVNVAKANLTVMSTYLQTAIKNGKMTSINIPQETKDLVTKLELQAGYLPGLTMSLLSVTNKDKEVLQHIESKDKSTITVIYKDGSTETFKTGMYEPPTNNENESERKRRAITEMKAKLQSVTGGDGKVSPNDWAKAKNAWALEGYNVEDFDVTFKGFKNPDNQYYE